MSRRASHRGAALLAFAVLATACTSAEPTEPVSLPASIAPSSVSTAAIDAASTTVAVGTSDVVADAGPGLVLFDATDVDQPSTLNITTLPLDSTPQPPQSLQIVGAAMEVELVGGELVDSIEFEVSADSVPPFAPGLPGAWMMWFDTESGEWVPVDTSVTAEGSVTAQVDHLSLFGWFTPDFSWVWDAFEGAARGVFGDQISGVDQPTCQDEEGARAEGISVNSDFGDGVKSCVGLEDGEMIVRIANGRLYSVAVEAPDGFEARTADYDGLIQSAASIVEFEYDDVMRPAETTTFAAPTGTTGIFNVDASAVTGLVDLVAIYVDLLANVFGIPAATVAAALDADCVLANTQELLSDDLATATSAAVGVSLDCATSAVAAVIGGFAGWLFRAFMAVVSVGQAIMVGIVGGISGLVDILRGEDRYRIAIGYQPSLEAPTWDEIANAQIPSICGHPPTQLVDGSHTGIEANAGELELLDVLHSGESGYVALSQSDVGPLTVVVARCNAGGVGWPHEVIAFGPGAEFYASTSLTFADGVDWDDYNLDGPGRSAMSAIGRSLPILGTESSWISACTSRGRAAAATPARRLWPWCLWTGASTWPRCCSSTPEPWATLTVWARSIMKPPSTVVIARRSPT